MIHVNPRVRPNNVDNTIIPAPKFGAHTTHQLEGEVTLHSGYEQSTHMYVSPHCFRALHQHRKTLRAELCPWFLQSDSVLWLVQR